jgi:CRISPR-associated protein Cas5d
MPYLGVREFPAHFRLLEDGEEEPPPDPSLEKRQDLGWMLHDIDFANAMQPRFFRAHLTSGVIEVPPWHSAEVKS